MNKQLTEFEQGRQDALAKVEKSVKRQLDFLKDIDGRTEGMAYTQGERNAMKRAYEYVMSFVYIEKKYEEIKNLIA